MASLESTPFQSSNVPEGGLESNRNTFPFVNGSSQNVQDKYLEGVPYTGSTDPNFPGPFFGKTESGMQNYVNEQRGAVNNYSGIATEPLNPLSKTFPANTQGQQMSCADSYPKEMREFPTFDPNVNNINVFQRESPDGSMDSYGMNREGMAAGMDMAIASGGTISPNPEYINQMAHNQGRRVEEMNTGGVEQFKDNSISDPCNQTGFGKIVPEFVKFDPNSTPGWVSPTDQIPTMGKSSAQGNALTQIEDRPIEQFSHNNMVPFYGAKLTQNMRATGVPQAGDNNSSEASTDGFADQTPYRGKLSAFTGCDDMWMHKRETGPMFSPAEQQSGWVFGSPAFRADLDRYKTDVVERRNESPVEKIQVGPGIGLDYSVPAAGGHQQYTRILPNNVDNYKANQLEGRVNAGKWSVNHPTSQYVAGVNQNQPKVEWTQARRPTMQQKFDTNATDASSARLTDWNITANKGKQSRTDLQISAGFGQTEYNQIEQFQDENGNLITGGNGFNQTPGKDPLATPCVSFSEAPVGMTMGSRIPAQSMERGSFATIRPTLSRIKAGYNSKEGYWECPDEEAGNNQFDVTMGPVKSRISNGGQRDGWFANLTDRGDINPFVINVSGTEANPGGVWSPNSFQDEQKVTTRQTTLFSHQGGPTGEKATEMTWSDEPKVTTKETTSYAHQGAPSGNKASEITWSDAPRTTTKETTTYAHQGGTAGSVPALGDRFAYTGADYFNPKLNSGPATMNSRDSNRGKADLVYSLQDRNEGRPTTVSQTMFTPGREEFTSTPVNFGITDFFKSVKLLTEEAFGEVETFIWGAENSDTTVEHYGEKDANGNPYFDPKLFEAGQNSYKTEPITNNDAQWRKGGMTSNGLRQSSEVWNHFPTPGRSNIIPDPNQPLDTTTDNPSNGQISSIGTYQTRGTKQIASSSYGPGTLTASNVQMGAGQTVIPNDGFQGYVRQNALRSQFVDYRSTAPFLVDNLRKNPLSIYATRDNVDNPLPEFFNMVKPDNFATYKSEPEINIAPVEKQLYVDGSPQSTILGLAEENPLMGITSGIVNKNPKFSGKAYSGKKANISIYNMAWTDNFGKETEGFSPGANQCQNKALDFAAQGYNISNQINNDNFIERDARTNLPWGPKEATENPLTQLGGLWTGSVGKGTYNVVNRNDYPSHLSDASQGTFTLDQRLQNDYKDGLPGSLVA